MASARASAGGPAAGLRQPRAVSHRRTLWAQPGRLLATSMDGRRILNAYSGYYVYLADAVLECSKCASGARMGCAAAARVVLRAFLDSAAGRLLLHSGTDHETLILAPSYQRRRDQSGNGHCRRVHAAAGRSARRAPLLAAAGDARLRAGVAGAAQHPHAQHRPDLTALEDAATACGRHSFAVRPR